MTTERRFFLLGRTRGERIRNVLGLVAVAGFLLYRQVDTSLTHEVTLDVPAAVHRLPDREALAARAAAWAPGPAALDAAAAASGRSPDAVRQGLRLTFELGDGAAPDLQATCTAPWDAAQTAAACRPLFDDLQQRLADGAPR